MSILIKGIKLPRHCIDCFALGGNKDSWWCCITDELHRKEDFEADHKRMAWCPLVDIKKNGMDCYDCAYHVNGCSNSDATIEATNHGIKCSGFMKYVPPFSAEWLERHKGEHFDMDGVIGVQLVAEKENDK